MTTMRCPYCGGTESAPATDGAAMTCAECEVEMESRDEAVNSDVARELLAGLHPSAERELSKREPDWNDLCSSMGGATLFVAAPALARAVIALTASRDAASDAFDRLVSRVWAAATGDTHEGPASEEALLAEVRRLRTDNARLDDVTRGALDDLAKVRAELAAVRAAARELAAAEAAHDAALAGSDHDEWAFATRMAPFNARVQAARAALDALTKSEGGDRG